MMALVIAIHVMVCLLLIGIILIQSGRGGGLVDSFSGVESMFGTKTNTFLTKTTTVLAILFFITVLTLAFLSAKQSKSLMRNLNMQKQIPLKEAAETPPFTEATQAPESPQTETLKENSEVPQEIPEALPQTPIPDTSQAPTPEQEAPISLAPPITEAPKAE